MKRQLNWLDYFLLLIVIAAVSFIVYDRYLKTIWFPVQPPPAKYQLDRNRRAEVERVANRLSIDKDWYTLVILPCPRNQGSTHDDFMRSYYDGELSPLVQRATRYRYVEGINEIPKQFQWWLAKRKGTCGLIFALCYKDKPVYWDEIPAETTMACDGLPWVHHVVDDMLTTLHRWMSQQ